MNEKLKEVYVKFHTNRRLKIEKLTEERFQYYISEGFIQYLPAIRKDALYWAMEQRSEEDEFKDFSKLLLKECLSIFHRMDNGNKVCMYDDIEHYPEALVKHFGVNDGKA